MTFALEHIDAGYGRVRILYDVTVTVPGTGWVRTFAGHLEDGRPSTSDPALGR